MSDKRKSKIIVIGNPTNKSFIEDLIKQDIYHGESFVIASHSDSGKDASKITFEAIDPDKIMPNNLPEVIFKDDNKPDYGFKHSPWLVPDFIGFDVQKEITIMKSASCGKTETPAEFIESFPDSSIEDWQQIWDNMRIDTTIRKEGRKKLQQYMDNLNKRYGR